MRRRLLVLGMLAVVGLAATGCGGSEKEEAGPGLAPRGIVYLVLPSYLPYATPC